MFTKLLRSAFVLLLGLCFSATVVWAQTGTIQGHVTDQSTGEALISANVYIPSLERGAATNTSGDFTISDIPYGTYELRVSYIGYKTKTITVTVDEPTVTVDVALVPGTGELKELIVTGFGTAQRTNELTYSAENLNVEAVTESGSAGLMASLGAKVAGLHVSSRSAMGASTDIILRGINSLTGGNQVLFVVDGVPLPNSRFNTAGAQAGFRGYDFGSTALDINPANIKSITVLKGAAATALYGSRAANGAIIITTKKGAPAGEAVTVSFSSSVSFSRVIPETFPSYQQKYGAGYPAGPNDEFFKIANPWTPAPKDSLFPVVKYTADASRGARFDPSLGVYQWGAFYPGHPHYQEKTPWVASPVHPIEFFNTGHQFKNSLFIRGGINNGGGYYSLGYTQKNVAGVMPNSSLDKYMLSFAGGYDITDELRVQASFDYSHTEALGRPAVGYSSIMTSFRQWWQTNVNILAQKAAYFRNHTNATWNLNSTRTTGLFWGNPYFVRYENYTTDARDRYVGYAQFQWDAADWLTITGRVSYTGYSQLIETRIAVGSVDIPDYTRRTYDYSEYNFRLEARYNTQLTESIEINGIVGFNARRTHRTSIQNSTVGGLIVPGVYSLDNSANPVLFPEETDIQLGVNGIYASLNVDYNDYLFLRITGRRDKASSLPVDNNTYFYPSVGASFLFSELLETDWLSMGKLRASWARVGSTAEPLSLRDTYTRLSNFSGVPTYTLPDTKNNSNLKPEITESYEFGLQLGFFNGRLYLDATWYHSSTFNQIFRAAISTATGYEFKWVNAGEIMNRGIEIMLRGRPITTNNFTWQASINFTRNINRLVALRGDLQYLELVAPQGGVSIGAQVGEPIGVLRGADYVYSPKGKRIINVQTTKSGEKVYSFMHSGPNEIIGNMNPEWTAGFSTRFSYKNWSLNFLIDIRWGGEIFSLDQYYGQGTGLYPRTARINDRGVNIRKPVSQGGGVQIEGVTWQDTNGNGEIDDGDTFTPVSPYVPAGSVLGYSGGRPLSAYVYDASYIKLREVGITYRVPAEFLESIGGVDRASISLIARNPWIIYKNLPYADPENSLSSGSLGGYSGGNMPAIRSLTFNIKLNF